MPMSYYSTGSFPRPRLTPAETPAQRETRLDRERAMLEEARAELRAGQGMDIDDPQVAAWLDGLDGDEDIPPPEPNTPPVPGL